MKKEGLRTKKPLLYCTIILSVIAIVCGAALGLGYKFLATDPDTSGDLGIIFNVLTGTKEHTVIFDEKTGDTFKVGGENITIEKAKRDADKILAAYRIENGGKVYILIQSKGPARNAGDLQAITAYIVNTANKAEADKIAGMRPLSAPNGEYKNAYTKTFVGTFADKTASKGFDIAGADGYTGSTITANGFIEAVNNASAFYKTYRESLLGVADTPQIKALKAAYKWASGMTAVEYAGLPADVTLYMTNDGLPVFDLDAGDYNIIISFAERHGHIGGVALYNDDGVISGGALAAAVEKAVGTNEILAGKEFFQSYISSGLTGEDETAAKEAAGLIHDAYGFITGHADIYALTAAYTQNIKNAIDKIANKVNGTTGQSYTVTQIVTGLESATASLNSLKFRNNNYYTAYRLTGGDYVFLATAKGYADPALGMTYINKTGFVREFLMIDCPAENDEAGYKHYLDGNKEFLADSYRGMLVQVSDTTYQSAEGTKSGPTATDPDPDVGKVTTSYNAVAKCIYDAVRAYRAATAV